MTPDEFLSKAKAAAEKAGHVWPEYAACEAALESAWGTSKLAIQGNNLFGQKHGSTTKEWPTISIKTKEYRNGYWVIEPAYWAAFPDWATCFLERMELLHKLSCYADALKATSGVEYVREVSKHWATDPARADKVLTIHGKHFPSITVTETI